jgi:sarcosine oxidase / L-pipecolate oxidase
MSSTQQSYLIVGAGIFGISTAICLKRSNPTAIVTVIDRTPYPNPSAASHDLNKVIRADYDDIFYMKLALEALELWRSDPIYKPYYHESGMLFAEDRGMGSQVLANYRVVGAGHKAEMLTPQIARERFGGIYKDANWTDVPENFYNPNSGWGEADYALQRMTEVAIEEGVIYIEATITTLLVDSSRTCTGAKTEDGTEFAADHIVLCTGARTALILADTAPEDQDLQVNGRMVAAGAVTCYVRLNAEQLKRFSKVPAIFNGMYHTHGLLILIYAQTILCLLELIFRRMYATYIGWSYEICL